MNIYFVTLLFPLIAVPYSLRVLRRATENPTSVPLQFSLYELLLMSFGVAVWFGVEPLDRDPLLAIYRMLLSFCAMLTVKDIVPHDPFPRKALIYIFIGLSYAVTGGLAMIFWWAYLLLRKSDEKWSRSGARIAACAGGVYLSAFFLPLEYPIQTDLWGYGCYVGALTQGVERLLWGFGFSDERDVQDGIEIYQSVWSANVLLWIAWIYIARARIIAALCVSLCAIALAVQFYYAGNAGIEFVFLPAYHLWIFGMLLTAILSLVAIFRVRSADQLNAN